MLLNMIRITSNIQITQGLNNWDLSLHIATNTDKSQLIFHLKEYHGWIERGKKTWYGNTITKKPSRHNTFRKWGPLIVERPSVLRSSKWSRISWISSRSSTREMFLNESITQQFRWSSKYLCKNKFFIKENLKNVHCFCCDFWIE